MITVEQLTTLLTQNSKLQDICDELNSEYAYQIQETGGHAWVDYGIAYKNLENAKKFLDNCQKKPGYKYRIIQYKTLVSKKAVLTLEDDLS